MKDREIIEKVISKVDFFRRIDDPDDYYDRVLVRYARWIETANRGCHGSPKQKTAF